jgi:hypothetical protein
MAGGQSRAATLSARAAGTLALGQPGRPLVLVARELPPRATHPISEFRVNEDELR